MKKTVLLVIVMLTACLPAAAQKKYDKMWKAVEQAQQDDLPRQVISQTEKIMKTAQRDGNFPQEMKAWIMMVNELRNLSPDSMQVVTAPEYKHNDVNDAVANALLFTSVTDKGDSIKESYLNKIFQNKEVLYATKTDDFLPLITKGEDSRLFGDDMLSLLTHYINNTRAFANKMRGRYTGQVAQFYKEKGNRNAYTLMQLMAIKAKRYEVNYSYADSLKMLLDQSADIEAGADVAKAYYDSEAMKDIDETVKFVRWAMKQFPKDGKYFAETERMLMNSKITIGSKALTHTALANIPFNYSIDYHNISEFTLEVRLYNGLDKGKNLRTDGKLIQSKNYTVGNDSLNNSRKAENLPIRGTVNDTLCLPAEQYVLVAKGAGKEIPAKFILTNLVLFTADIPQKGTVAYVMNNVTGKPVKGAIVKAENTSNKLSRSFTTDKDGTALLDLTDDKEVQWTITAQTSERNKTASVSIYKGATHPSTNSATSTVATFIYPARTIYRPGQTVNVAVVAYTQNGDTTQVYSKDSIEIELSNGEGISMKQKAMPNELGTASYSFVIPKDASPGVYIISSGDNSSYADIRIEEYKLPTYYIQDHRELLQDSTFTLLTPNSKLLTFNDTARIALRAMTYSGVPVQNAKVTYRTDIRTGKGYYSRRHVGILYDTLYTDNQGYAILPLYLDARHDEPSEKQWTVTYRISYTVTDQAGESHDGSHSFSISRQAFNLRIELYDNIIDLSHQHKNITLYALNADNEPVDSTEVINPRYRIMDIDSTLVAEGAFSPNKPFVMPDIPAGEYTILISATDRGGNLIEADCDITVFSSAKKKFQERTHFEAPFFHSTELTFSEDEPATIYFSPATDSTYVHLLVTANDRLVEEKAFIADRQTYCLSYPYKKEYGDGICVNLFYARNGDTEYLQQSFTYREPDKHLNLTWKTFRDCMTPGEKTQWTLSVKTKDGKPLSKAGLVATMYDSSLETVFKRQYDYAFTPSFNRWVDGTDINNGHHYQYLHMSLLAKNGLSVTRTLRKFSSMDYAFDRQSQLYGALREVPVLMGAAHKVGPVNLTGSIAGLDLSKSEIAVGAQSASLSPLSTSSGILRKNLTEQAFFYPNLVSDKNGEINIDFTLPESITEWKFYGVVHDKNMNGARIVATTIARQEFMIRPNMPRFLREGDQATITASIFNQTDKAISGTAQIRLLTDSDSLICTLNEPFTVGPQASTPVIFTLPSASLSTTLPTREGAWSTSANSTFNVDITASSSTFSDGERHQLVVLTPNSKLLTPNSDCKSVNLGQMVFDALEMMKVSQEDNTVSHAASLYANVKLKELSKTNDSIDTDSLDYYIAKSTQRLKELQNADGSWSWFAGMEGSYHITLLTCENLAKLNTVGRDMLAKGMDFLDSQELYYFRSLQTSKHPSYYPSESTLHYLYILTQMPERTLSKEVQVMCDTYVKQLQKMSPDLSILGKSNSSIILRHNGKEKQADKFVQSVLEYSVYKPGMGRYFDTQKAHYSWRDYRIPTQLAAIRAIRASLSPTLPTREGATPNSSAFCSSAKALTPNSTQSVEMLLWLLRQKQVQRWDNPANTVDVADLLLQASKDGTAMDWTIVTDDSAYFAEGLKIETKFEGQMEVGNTVSMVITVTADRDMDFVKVTALHPACFEPKQQTSGYRWLGNGGGYVSHHDSYTDLFFDTFRKGTHTFRLTYYIDRMGTYNTGTSSVQCTYCPDFQAHTTSQTIKVLK